MTLDAIETFVLRAALADWTQTIAAASKLYAVASRIAAELLAAGRLGPATLELGSDDLHSLSVILYTYAPRPMPGIMRQELAALRRRIEGAERAAAPPPA